jgi:hypothetical protein
MKKIDITPQELCERLFRGERFCDKHGTELFFDGRFKGLCGGTDAPININNWFGKDIYTKPRWTDNLSAENPVLCWVWYDQLEDAVKREVYGVNQLLGRYITDDGGWDNAEPVKPEDACIWEEET